MNFIEVKNQAEENVGVSALAERICNALIEGKKALWLVSGGSNIPIAVKVMRIIKSEGGISEKKLGNLTVTLMDERYGPVGHADSNWKQLMDSGFSFSDINTMPVLTGLGLEETESEWASQIKKVFASKAVIMGQFGMGSDGHIAGILPNSPAVSESGLVSAYQSEKFTRITLTFETLKKIDVAYLFAFGDSKKEQIKKLHDSENDSKNISLAEQPAQILKSLKEVYIYCN
ncbi:MAG: 6-phosphogluconolactonase [Candidatus Taylorbacteria bacterium]|nr:6-phosphogluconolactonase [Candidatus Taylorbacteria bacterium]